MNLNPAQSKFELQLKSLQEQKIPKVQTNFLIRVVLLPDNLNEKQLRMELIFPFKECITMPNYFTHVILI